MLDVRLLGGFEVVVDGRPVTLGGLRQRAVLAALLLRANEVVSVDSLADDVWGGEPPASAATTLRAYLSNLRRAVEGASLQIEAKKPGYVVTVDPEAIDIVRFDRWCDEGSRALRDDDPATAAEVLRRALALWRGPALGDFAYEQFAESTIVRLEEMRLLALEERIEADLALGEAGDLVGELDQLVRENPLREALRAQLMRVLQRTGRRAEALRVYQEGRHRLIEDLGLEPGTALQRLEQSILLQEDNTGSAPSRPASSTELPAGLTTFVGRQTEIADVTEQLAAHRLVTLTGPGGSGKTRLSLEVAQSAASVPTDGVWFVELASLAEAELIDSRVASALGLRGHPEQPPLDSLVEALRATEGLLVLDNCEHIVSQAGRLCHALLTACPRLRILATSRQALGVPGELAWSLPSLPVPDGPEARSVGLALQYDAVRLFVERARSALPGFEATDATIAMITHICRRLDGLPLAIELAAARLRVLSVGQVAARLDDRFKLLGNRNSTMVERQRTLRAAIDWSYDLLAEAERALFARLSVFAGPFELELVEAVCVDEELRAEDVLDGLSGLVDKSLVTRLGFGTDDARYKLLESLREYARERLRTRGEEPAFARNHAISFVHDAEAAQEHIHGPNGVGWLDRLEDRHDDYRAALDWCLTAGEVDLGLALATALWPFWDARYHIREGRLWFQRLLADGSGSREVRVAALAAAADLAYWDDDFTEAQTLCNEGLALEPASQPALMAQFQLTLAEVARDRDGLAEAETLANHSLQMFKQADDGAGYVRALCQLALLARDRGDLRRTEELATELLDASQAGYHGQAAVAALGTLGTLAQARGDLTGARELFQRCLDQSRAIRDQWSAARATARLGTIEVAVGDSDVAYELGRNSLAMYEDLRSNEGIAESLLVMADAALLSTDSEQAKLLASAALDRCRERGFSGQLTWALQTSAAVALQRGDIEGSAALAEEAVELYRRGQTRDAGWAVLLLGTVRAREGVGEAATELCQESLDIFQQAGDQRGVARSLVGLAEAAFVRDEPLAAVRYLSAAQYTRDRHDVDPTPADEAEFAALLASAKRALGDAAFARAWHPERRPTEIDLREPHGADAPAESPPSSR